ncbi:hypothetical protein [Streptomyces sp. enrichment culture]|uniref:hypothetical protein n=1 Tax=Streptomyces sp. enrichment culture TaxID=1795815 RepID=UPI003F565563
MGKGGHPQAPAARLPFCRVVHDGAPAQTVREWADALAIVSGSGGCTGGHLQALPRRHVADFTIDPIGPATVQLRARELAQEPGGHRPPRGAVRPCPQPSRRVVFN